jgi:hypothetical protein
VSLFSNQHATYVRVVQRTQWLTLPRWFAGEAERIQGTVSTPAAPGRRIFTIKQPIGVAVALVPWNFPIVCEVYLLSYRTQLTVFQGNDPP